MIYLGIDTQSFLIYEGRSKHGARALWPEPILSPTAFGLASNSTLPSVPFDSWHAAKYLFREDSYDPASKIRRGVFTFKRLRSLIIHLGGFLLHHQ